MFTVTFILAASPISSVVVVPPFANVLLHDLFQISLSYVTSAFAARLRILYITLADEDELLIDILQPHLLAVVVDAGSVLRLGKDACHDAVGEGEAVAGRDDDVSFGGTHLRWGVEAKGKTYCVAFQEIWVVGRGQLEHPVIKNGFRLHEAYAVDGDNGYLVDAVRRIDNLHLPIGMIDTVGIITRLCDAVDFCLQEGIELTVIPVDVHGIALGLCH